METDPGSKRFYARIKFTGAAPTQIKVSNIGDKPISSSVVNVSKPHGITVLKADYDGTILSVAAASRFGNALTVDGLGALATGATPDATQSANFTVVAPPERITLSDAAGGQMSMAVSILGGDATPEGLPPVTPQPDPGPVIDPAPDPAAPAVARATASVTSINYGGSVVLDGSTSTGAVSYK